MTENHVSFTAHRSILSSHSGFFRRVLQQISADVTIINLPYIDATVMLDILTWMYSGDYIIPTIEDSDGAIRCDSPRMIEVWKTGNCLEMDEFKMAILGVINNGISSAD